MRISVYITSYNQKQYLGEAIESVLNQTIRASEIIIVDDCSSDGSREIIAGYASRYPKLVRPIYHEMNKGVARTRNDALRSIDGDHVTFVDGDDRFLPEKLEREANCLESHPEADLVFSNFYSIDECGRRLWLWIEDEDPPGGDMFVQTFAKSLPKNIHFRNELVRYRALKNVGFYDPGLEIYEDYDMGIRLTKKLRAVYNPEPSVEYRRHRGGLSCANLDVHLKSLRHIYRKNYKMLSDVPKRERTYVARRWKQNYASLLKSTAIRKIQEQPYSVEHRLLALKLLVEGCRYKVKGQTIKLIMLLMLPRKVYALIEKNYLEIKDRQKEKWAL